MDEYVKKSDVMKALQAVLEQNHCGCELVPEIYDAVRRVRKRDVVPAKVGWWKFLGYHGYARILRCSACGTIVHSMEETETPKECICGARMARAVVYNGG